jgi:hypothetical protein
MANPLKISLSFWLKGRNQFLVSSWTRSCPRLLVVWLYRQYWFKNFILAIYGAFSMPT